MFQINARTRLVICLVMQVVSVLLLAIPLHLVPDRRGAIGMWIELVQTRSD